MGLISKPQRMCIYREKSATTALLSKAMCEASLKFQPIHFDSAGRDDDGREYRYASLAAIKKATSKALCEAGIWIHSEYGFDDRGRYICVTVEKDDEWVASSLDIPQASTLRKRKAAMTQLRRAAIEALLDLSAEQDSDAEGVEDATQAVAEDAPDTTAGNEKPSAWADMRRLASDAIVAAATAKTVESKIAKVKEKVEAGDMDPSDLADLERLAEVRIAEIEAAAEKAGMKPEPVGGAA